MGLPKLNWALFGGYTILCLVVLIATIVSPLARQYAPAPLRDAILPPPNPIIVTLLYSTEKEDFLKQVSQDFDKTYSQVNGHPIHIEMKPMGSRELVLAVLDGKEKPTLISPASTLQISILQDLSAGKFGRPLVNSADHAQCRSVFTTPLVLVAWRERADVLWGSSLPADLWKHLHDAVVDPQGWGTLGHPDWGYVKFGHTSPLSSNSGLMTILLMTYNYYGESHSLTSGDILSNPDYQKWFLEIEGTISKFGDSTGTYMKDMVAYGPSMYDMITVYEATAIEQADNANGRYGELRVYYPPATVMSDHPFCLLNADWVSNDQAQGAKAFLTYLQSRPVQELALMKYGFRPADPGIPLDQAGSPLSKYATNGLQIKLPAEVALPKGDVLNTLLDFWTRNINR
jgi:hypothetical protein